MKLNTNSNAYTVGYAAVMVIIVAFLLAFVSSALKETQDANVENDTKGQILTALGYDKTTINVPEVFAQNVQDKVLENGELQDYAGKFNTAYGALIKAGTLHIFEATAADGSKAYVLPVVGRGLWGGLWGYIAVDETKTQVLGTYFYHESETAGLGARIGEREFQEKFIGKPLAEGGDVLTVVKDGAAKKATEVDGVTGATLTSKGVAAMVEEAISSIYAEFLGGVGVPAPCAEMAEGQCCGKCAEVAEGECCGKCAEGECSHEECAGECPAEKKCCGKCQKNVEQ